MRRHTSLFSLLLLLAAASCGGGTDKVETDLDSIPRGQDTAPEIQVGGDVNDLGEDPGPVDVAPGGDVIDASPDIGPSCAPGEGCFQDPCSGNGDCQSGWCVEHMGESVCSQLCLEDCPDGWACKQVAGSEPDVVFLCVSNVATLCKPCATSADCAGTAGEAAPCVDYGGEGSFCGGVCASDVDCPWGFSCLNTQTVDGVETEQCVADAGVCPCTAKSADLGLFTPCEVVGEAGVCGGKRVCTDEGLSDCDAPTPAPELCNGLDDDCDEDIDEETCDDENPCTDDLCLGAEGCNHIPLNEGECMDGDPCTVADHCEAGVCVGAAVECDDQNPCTEDICTATGGCEFAPVFGPCDDGDPCTMGDLCDEGLCAGTPIACACTVDDDCAPLEDGDLCTGTLLCDTAGLPYQCALDPTTVIDCPLPEGPDGPCLALACDPASGACSLVPANDGAPCEDGDLCTMGDVCAGGLCGAGSPVNCNDGNPCTDEECQPDQGCVFTQNSAPCQDGDACTSGDTCAGGACVPGLALNCDDDNPCTADTCLPTTGCTHTDQDGPCDDGSLCTTGEQCAGGSCGVGAPLVCDDGNLCTTDTCDPVLGCVFSLNEVPCDDGSLCTTGDHCHLGSCIGGQALVCDDTNPCTDDACDPQTGCTFTANTADCDDGNECTTGEQCAGGWCLGEVLVCGDDNICTDDACDPQTGCTFTQNTAACDDDDACTEGDSCSAGACAGVQISCVDDDPCTDDACDSQTGCAFTPNTAACDDDDACTENDICSDGACAGLAISCDDQEPCTTDACDPQSGCTHTPLPDETDCGQDLWCQAGVCVEHAPQTLTFDTLNYNGMTGWPLDFEACGCCSGTTTQQQMDALCELAGFTSAVSWEASPQYINTCYCWGGCSNYAWQSDCCSGWQTQVMVTEVTCQQ